MLARNSANTEKGQKYCEKAVLYYRNAREELRRIPVKDGFYVDEKHLRRAAGVCWLAVRDAAKGFLLKHGVSGKHLRSADAYRHLLLKYAKVDGKLIKSYESASELVHVAVYYEGLADVDAVKLGFERARFVIEKLTASKV